MMTPNEIESGFNLLMGVAATAAAFVFWRKWRKSACDGRPLEAYMTSAVFLSMASGAVLALLLTPLYVGQAAGLDGLVQWARDNLVFAVNAAKAGIGIAALLHIRGLIEGHFGKMWPLAVALVATSTFLVGGLFPRML